MENSKKRNKVATLYVLTDSVKSSCYFFSEVSALSGREIRNMRGMCYKRNWIWRRSFIRSLSYSISFITRVIQEREVQEILNPRNLPWQCERPGSPSEVRHQWCTHNSSVTCTNFKVFIGKGVYGREGSSKWINHIHVYWFFKHVNMMGCRN